MKYPGPMKLERSSPPKRSRKFWIACAIAVAASLIWLLNVLLAVGIIDKGLILIAVLVALPLLTLVMLNFAWWRSACIGLFDVPPTARSEIDIHSIWPAEATQFYDSTRMLQPKKVSEMRRRELKHGSGQKKPFGDH